MTRMTLEEINEIFNRFNVEDGIIKHSIAVTETAMEIGKKIGQNGHDVDLDALWAASMLHDIGKMRRKDIRHDIETGKMLRECGVDEKIIHIAEMHCAEKKQMPLLCIEAKILKYSDGLIMHTQQVSLDERFEEAAQRREKIGMHDEAKWIRGCLDDNKKLEKELFEMMKTSK